MPVPASNAHHSAIGSNKCNLGSRFSVQRPYGRFNFSYFGIVHSPVQSLSFPVVKSQLLDAHLIPPPEVISLPSCLRNADRNRRSRGGDEKRTFWCVNG